MTLAAGCSLRFSRAAAATSFALPAFARQARRPLGAELQINVRAGEVCARNRILRDDTTVVFDFNLHVIVWQYFVAKLENLGEGPGFQPVVIIVADPRLQQASISGFVNLAPAIDESLGDVAHFGNVEVPWNFVAIRQDKACDRVGVKGKRGFKFFQLHAGFYMRTTEYSQAQRFWNWKDGGFRPCLIAGRAHRQQALQTRRRTEAVDQMRCWQCNCQATSIPKCSLGTRKCNLPVA